MRYRGPDGGPGAKTSVGDNSRVGKLFITRGSKASRPVKNDGILSVGFLNLGMVDSMVKSKKFMKDHHPRFEQGIIDSFLNHCLHGLFLSELGGISQEQKDLTLQVQRTPIDVDFRGNKHIPFDSVQQWLMSIASKVQAKLKEKNSSDEQPAADPSFEVKTEGHYSALIRTDCLILESYAFIERLDPHQYHRNAQVFQLRRNTTEWSRSVKVANVHSSTRGRLSLTCKENVLCTLIKACGGVQHGSSQPNAWIIGGDLNMGLQHMAITAEKFQPADEIGEYGKNIQVAMSKKMENRHGDLALIQGLISFHEESTVGVDFQPRSSDAHNLVVVHCRQPAKACTDSAEQPGSNSSNRASQSASSSSEPMLGNLPSPWNLLSDSPSNRQDATLQNHSADLEKTDSEGANKSNSESEPDFGEAENESDSESGTPTEGADDNEDTDHGSRAASPSPGSRNQSPSRSRSRSPRDSVVQPIDSRTPRADMLLSSLPDENDFEELAKLLWPAWHTFPAVGTIRSPGDPDIELHPNPQISSKNKLEYFLHTIEYWREREIQYQRYNGEIPWDMPASQVKLSKDQFNRCKKNWMVYFMQHESEPRSRHIYYCLMEKRNQRGINQDIHQLMRRIFNAYLHESIGVPQVALTLLLVGATPENLRHALAEWLNHRNSSSHENAVRKSQEKSKEEKKLKKAAHEARSACKRAEKIARRVRNNNNIWWRLSHEERELWKAHQDGSLEEARNRADEKFNRSVTHSDSAMGCMLSAMDVSVQGF